MARSTSTQSTPQQAEAATPASVPTPESANPKPQSDHGSAAAPGVRTEAEVIADEKAALDQRQAAAAAPGAGSPALIDDVPPEPSDKLVHFLRESDGTVQSVNEGTPEHASLVRDPAFRPTTRAKAKDATPRSFVRHGRTTRR